MPRGRVRRGRRRERTGTRQRTGRRRGLGGAPPVRTRVRQRSPRRASRRRRATPQSTGRFGDGAALATAGGRFRLGTDAAAPSTEQHDPRRPAGAGRAGAGRSGGGPVPLLWTARGPSSRVEAQDRPTRCPAVRRNSAASGPVRGDIGWARAARAMRRRSYDHTFSMPYVICLDKSQGQGGLRPRRRPEL